MVFTGTFDQAAELSAQIVEETRAAIRGVPPTYIEREGWVLLLNHRKRALQHGVADIFQHGGIAFAGGDGAEGLPRVRPDLCTRLGAPGVRRED